MLQCAPEDVFRVLADGWLYPCWVVGASRMREVEDAWPQPGSRLHHSFGAWPALIDDVTVVEAYDPPRRMVMRARGWPIGEARVVIRLAPVGAETEVKIEEEPVSGPGALVPPAVRGLSLKWRNTETLRRLAFIAERRR